MRIKVNKAGTRKDIRRIFLCMIIAIISTHTLLLILVLTKSVDVSQTRNYAYAVEKTTKRDSDTFSESLSSPQTRQVATKSVESDAFKELIQLKGSATLLLSSGGPGLLSAISGFSPLKPNRVNLFWCTKVEYRPEVGPMIALASFPGSGNTWIRYLLQQASGYLTGSVYKDYSLLRNGFPAESVANGSVIIVKTHEWGLFARRQFDKAVLLIRNPFKTLLAEFNRRSAGHLGHASPDRYLKGKGWRDFAVSQVTAWSQFTLDWLNFEGPLLIMRYENMVNDIENQLKRLFVFVNVTVRPNVIECVVKHREGVFKRPNRLLPFDPFSVSVGDISLRKFVEKRRLIVYEAIRRKENSENYMFNVNVATSTRHLKNVINASASFVEHNQKTRDGDKNATDKDISVSHFSAL